MELSKKELEFMAKLKALLIEYSVEIAAEDEWQGYAECGQDIKICFEFGIREAAFGTRVDSDLEYIVR